MSNYNDCINFILNEKKIEGNQLKNIDILNTLFNNKCLSNELRTSFTKDYIAMYGNDFDYQLLKIQDMVYSLNTFVDILVDKFQIVDSSEIKNMVSSALKDKDISFFDAVNYNNDDLEIVENYTAYIQESLSVKEI